MRLFHASLLAALMTLSPLAAKADAIADGKKVYMTKTCMACHGRGGARPVMSYPMLAGQNEKYLLQQLKDIQDGKRIGSQDPATGHPFVQGMADIMHLLSEDDIKNVAKYLTSLEPGAPHPVDPAPDAALIAEGEKAFKGLGCRSCHGADGSKPTAKDYPFIAGMNAEYLARAMTEIRDKVRVNGKSKLMFGTIKKASDEEILAIATWLSTIDRTQQ